MECWNDQRRGDEVDIDPSLGIGRIIMDTVIMIFPKPYSDDTLACPFDFYLLQYPLATKYTPLPTHRQWLTIHLSSITHPHLSDHSLHR
jgi:hypothetical protein